MKLAEKIEADFENVLRIRQLLGFAALDNARTNNDVVRRKSDLTMQLKQLFSTFIPEGVCKSEDIFDIISEAVDIREEITKELAIYSYYWFPADGKIDLDSCFCEFEGWNDEDPFPLCVLPGFGQSIKLHDGSIKELCIKPAKIVLEY